MYSLEQGVVGEKAFILRHCKQLSFGSNITINLGWHVLYSSHGHEM
jgi:hypothetical protein